MADRNSLANGIMLFQPGTLLDRAIDATARALRHDALKPITTHYELVEQDHVQFLVRTLAGQPGSAAMQEKRDSGTLETDNTVNPFLPYEPDMLVAEITPTHVCLLNKFTVIDHHLLIVTRAYEDQQSSLTLEDFVALGACMAEIDGLAFYNAGKAAGASQRHKHLQLVPLPLAPTGLPIPIEPALGLEMLGRGIQRAPRLPFRHALTRLDPEWWERPQDAAVLLLGDLSGHAAWRSAWPRPKPVTRPDRTICC